jgi:hypothetical protein
VGGWARRSRNSATARTTRIEPSAETAILPVHLGLGSGERFVEIGGERSHGGTELAHAAPAPIGFFGHAHIAPIMGLAGPVGGAVLVGVVPPRSHQELELPERTR